MLSPESPVGPLGIAANRGSKQWPLSGHSCPRFRLGSRVGGGSVLAQVRPPFLRRGRPRAVHRRLPVGSAFWTALAERLFNSVLWNEGKVPAGAKLTIDSGRSNHEAVQLAAGWDRQD